MMRKTLVIVLVGMLSGSVLGIEHSPDVLSKTATKKNMLKDNQERTVPKLRVPNEQQIKKYTKQIHLLSKRHSNIRKAWYVCFGALSAYQVYDIYRYLTTSCPAVDPSGSTSKKKQGFTDWISSSSTWKKFGSVGLNLASNFAVNWGLTKLTDTAFHAENIIWFIEKNALYIKSFEILQDYLFELETLSPDHKDYTYCLTSFMQGYNALIEHSEKIIAFMKYKAIKTKSKDMHQISEYVFENLKDFSEVMISQLESENIDFSCTKKVIDQFKQKIDREFLRFGLMDGSLNPKEIFQEELTLGMH